MVNTEQQYAQNSRQLIAFDQLLCWKLIAGDNKSIPDWKC